MQEIKVLSLSFKPIKTSSRLLPICLQTIRALETSYKLEGVPRLSRYCGSDSQRSNFNEVLIHG